MARIGSVGLGLVAALVLAVACAGDRDVSPDPATVMPTVTRHEVQGTAVNLTNELMAVGPTTGTMVGLSADYSDPLIRSTDGGITWDSADTPVAGIGDRGDLSFTWVEEGPLVVTGRRPVGDTLFSRPFVWVSVDDGRTFSEGRGMEEFLGEAPTSAAGIGSSLWVTTFGQFDEASPGESVLWHSGDGGRTWEVDNLPSELAGSGAELAVDAAAGRLVLLANGAVVASDDGGRTWRSVNPGPVGETRATTDGLLARRSSEEEPPRYLWSQDGGIVWTAIEALPAPNPDFPRPWLAQGPRSAAGSLFALGTDERNQDRGRVILYRSADSGDTWDVVDLRPECDDPELGLDISLPVEVGDALVLTRACGRQSALFASVDDGLTWRTIDVPGGSGSLREPIVVRPGLVSVRVQSGRGRAVLLVRCC